MTDTLAELQRLATEAADEAEGDWFDRDLIESNEPILSTRKARRFIAAANPALILRLVRIAQAAERAPSLSALNDLAKAYASNYATPNHITFTVEGLRNLIAAALREALGEKP